MEKELELVQSYLSGNEQAFNLLLERAAPMFSYFIKEIKYFYEKLGIKVTYEEVEDAKARGHYEFLRCVNRYDSSYATSLITYSWPSVKRGMYDEVMKNKSIIYIPRHMRLKCYEYIKINEDFKSEVGIYPPDSVLCLRMSIDTNKLKEIRTTLNLFKPINLDIALDYYFPSDTSDGQGVIVNTEKRIDQDRLFKTIFSMNNLTEKEKTIIEEIYKKEKCLSDIASGIHSSVQNVENIKRKSINKLRNSTRIKKFSNLVDD